MTLAASCSARTLQLHLTRLYSEQKHISSLLARAVEAFDQPSYYELTHHLLTLEDSSLESMLTEGFRFTELFLDSETRAAQAFDRHATVPDQNKLTIHAVQTLRKLRTLRNLCGDGREMQTNWTERQGFEDAVSSFTKYKIHLRNLLGIYV